MTGAEFSGVDIDLLADYIGGALEGTPDESAVATLIAEDPDWREAYESLSGGVTLVQSELGRLEPEPMPADLAARLDGMFSAPALTLVKGDAAAPTAEPAGRRRRWVTPIAIAAGFIAFVGFGADYLAGTSNDTQSDESASSTAGGGSADQAMSAPSEVILATGTNYTRATLATEPASSLASSGKASPPAMGAAEADRSRIALEDPALTRLSAPAALQECFEAIERENAGGVIGVQTVDFARFDGVSALIVRFTAENGDWVWAVGADCGTRPAGADEFDKVPVR
ncbi:hypothetical protein M1L60_32225 [Actinoplanes sp. TRM 88003]|uniref:Anti-sigma factor n=1 Tax=Paractinoplanes aksuensis TaxID=2939490 RepID=A0ABT1DWL7_9ACTN|nr:hypothetical protein [Actinoplanes aksuensis]MCO8275259.1 hypothetical protein [Actinoplanes aksuensis]